MPFDAGDELPFLWREVIIVHGSQMILQCRGGDESLATVVADKLQHGHVNGGDMPLEIHGAMDNARTMRALESGTLAMRGHVQSQA